MSIVYLLITLAIFGLAIAINNDSWSGILGFVGVGMVGFTIASLPSGWRDPTFIAVVVITAFIAFGGLERLSSWLDWPR